MEKDETTMYGGTQQRNKNMLYTYIHVIHILMDEFHNNVDSLSTH